MLSSPSGHPAAELREISAVHSDIVRSQILTRLDGASLAALSCTSSELHSLCTDEAIWREICAATWHSLADPRVQHVISTFPAGHRSFFSDSYPFVELRRGVDLPPSVSTTELISAVDIYYKGKVIFSRVQVTETLTGWFLCSPFRVDLLDPKETVSTGIQIDHQPDDDTWTSDLEHNLTLSWILIDPTRKSAANVSSRRPVSVHRHWLTGEFHVRFSAVLAGNRRRWWSETELVEFAVAVVVASGGRPQTVEVREVSLVAEDMEGKNIGGRRSLVILEMAMGGKRIRSGGGREEGKERYREFVRRKREREEEKRRRETAMDTAACLAGAGAAVFCSFFLCFYLFIR